MTNLSLKNVVKSLYYQIKLSLREDERIIETIQAQNLLPILNLHRVSPDENQFWSPMLPEHFDELLSYLTDRFQIVPFSEVRKVREPGSRPYLVLSFDDGYYDFFEFACPILKKHGVRANMNIIPYFSERGTLPWNLTLYDFLQRAPVSLIQKIKLPNFNATPSLSTSTDKTKFGMKISGYFKNRSREEREGLFAGITNLINEWGEKPSVRMMSIAEVKEIAKIHEIGVHSFRHDSMAHESLDYFANDYALCKDFFAGQLQIPLNIYAFPNGSYRPEQIDFLKNAGLDHILLVDEDYSRAGNQVHCRFTISGDSIGEIRLKSLGHQILGRK